MIVKDVVSNKNNSNDMPDSLVEYGFHYSGAINMVRNAAHVLKFFNQWPDAGGYFDQDAFLIDDIILWQQLENHISLQYKDEQ